MVVMMALFMTAADMNPLQPAVDRAGYGVALGKRWKNKAIKKGAGKFVELCESVGFHRDSRVLGHELLLGGRLA
jgi:hypothetical protein